MTEPVMVRRLYPRTPGQRYHHRRKRSVLVIYRARHPRRRKRGVIRFLFMFLFQEFQQFLQFRQ